ncbi:amidohydrolase 2 [Coriobacterium glomerans PW2]|uniref:Amidohydrolase 2 n=1 Tax=Coriobacterium glomerans (strain ATCC 49209 / DSM 20642 / JCM 10262 / PW2) TaxID=700015 RepID=F2N7K7_CORGP|nr:amidohydrolase family protein [Coriobacterium glomerans]AEB06823.1 amidohydrolase 2 [Coriobacterium glomerans PW2]
MVIDMHVHPLLYQEIYQSGSGPTGFETWESEFGMGHMGPMGFDELEAEMNAGDISRSVLLPIDLTATTGSALATNEQIAHLVEAHPDRLWGFASVDPHRADAANVLEQSFLELGAKGLCLHPAKQCFDPSDPELESLYKLCEEHNRPVLFEAGLSWEPAAPLNNSNPLTFERAIMMHPDVRFCLAHFAWPWVREMVALMLKYPNCYTDTSITYLDAPKEMMLRLFTVDMGPLWYERSLLHQVMFGSNTPRFRAFKLKGALDAVPMSKEARENLYWRTALRFLEGEGA